MKDSNPHLELDTVEPDPLEPRPLDLSKVVRGIYYNRVQAVTNIILLASDLMDASPTQTRSTKPSAA